MSPLNGFREQRIAFVEEQRRQALRPTVFLGIPLSFGIATVCLVAPILRVSNLVLPHLP